MPSKSRSLVGVWIGVTVGSLLLLILIIITIIICKRKRSRSKYNTNRHACTHAITFMLPGYSVALYDDQTRDRSLHGALQGSSEGVEWEMVESSTKTFTDTSDSTFEETDGEETKGLLRAKMQ